MWGETRGCKKSAWSVWQRNPHGPRKEGQMRIPRGIPVFALTLAILHPAAARAHGPNSPPHQLYRMGDFTLESG